MPVDNGVGYSAWTPNKQRFFRSSIRTHLKMAYGAMKKHGTRPKRYYYFDLNSGPGAHIRYGKGSPLIFNEEAEQFKYSYGDFSFSGLMVDIEPKNTQLCMDWLDKKGFYNSTARCCDNKEVLSEYSIREYRLTFGLIYCDPTGPSDINWNELATFFNYWKKADFLIALSATQIKRVNHLNGHHSLSEYIDSIPKRNWGVREPFSSKASPSATAHQWTFIYGSNGPIPVWENQKFFNLKSKEGQAIFKRLCLSKEEYANGLQPSLLSEISS